MNTYIYAGNSALLVVKDNDLNSVSSVRNHYLNIDWAWVIEEDGVLKFNGKEYDVKAGDIVLVLYASYNRGDDDRDIIGGKVIIHNDALGIPCFKKLWDADKADKEIATKQISYIVLKNKYDSPYVQSMRPEEIGPRLRKELFGDANYKLPVEVLEAEQAYINFNETLILGLLKNARLKLDSVSRYYAESLQDELDDKKVQLILAGMEKLGNTIKSLDALETAVRSEEMASSRVRGGVEVNPYELSNRQAVR